LSRILVALTGLLLAPELCQAITIDTVPVRNAGNAGDVQFNKTFGAVGYDYRIGTYEVTVGQYTAFLNAVAATDTYSLYDGSMAFDANIAGIARNGSTGSYSYSVIGSPNKPITYVSWGDAARFSNWLHNGQPNGPQNASTTENGAYSLNGATTDSALNAVTRNANATWFIPTENEWYKAAYYQPASQGGDSDNYWAYPTRSNVVPNSGAPPGAPGMETNMANYYGPGGNATGSFGFVFGQNYLTDVGAYASSSSFYGTFDQAGNVYELNETLVQGSHRGIRGGAWAFDSFDLGASHGDSNFPTSSFIGFRVATVPEPSSFVLAVLGLIGLAVWRRKR